MGWGRVGSEGRREEERREVRGGWRLLYAAVGALQAAIMGSTPGGVFRVNDYNNEPCDGVGLVHFRAQPTAVKVIVREREESRIVDS